MSLKRVFKMETKRLPPILSFVLVAALVPSCIRLTEAQQHNELTFGQRLVNQIAKCNEYAYYKIDVSEPCQDLRIQVDVIEGEPNLYVSKSPNLYPTYSSLAWSSYDWGSEDLVISSWDPEFTAGTFYIGVHAYCGDDVDTGYTDAQFSVYVTTVPSVHPHSEISLNGTLPGTLSVNGYDYYRFCVPSSCSNVEVLLTNCVDPKACPTDYAWPELIVSRSIEQPSISDHSWKLASVERRSISLRYSDPDFFPGHYFVAIYGWCTPTENCPDLSSCGPCTYAQNHPYTVSVFIQEVNEGCVPKQPLELCGGNQGFHNQCNSIILVVMLFFCSIVVILLSC
ncbi:uncharacterized protein [Apostichopus japonicus]|uniref:uncharacterized protein isoform X1 n=2 Tax=Stichopus japonicus TaxID=307972 RepID=UPI003AB15151